MFTSGVGYYENSAAFAYRNSTEIGSSGGDGAPLFMTKKLMAEKAEGMASILEKVESDKNFAKEMVTLYRNTPDRAMFNLEEALSSPEGLSFIQDRTAQFNEDARKVSMRREELYSEMRAKNFNDAEIFKALLEFNNSLPAEYKQIAGIVKVDTKI
ncbi:hypothetical protein [Marinimicrobium sp. ARAG 43.8]|uniref:hypothetical protein n=1 Tax=Marinimicrobium sp. ARAG 43.8 TaxID=3418719 RepID=UPI003CFA1FF9